MNHAVTYSASEILALGATYCNDMSWFIFGLFNDIQ